MRLIPALVFALFTATFAFAVETASTILPRSTPEEQGIPAAAIQRFIEDANTKLDEIHSFMLVRHGQVVAETWWSPYAANEQHVLYSLSKSFTSTAMGLAVAEGKLRIDDPVLKFFPDDAPAMPSKNLQAMRVRDLLTMSTGHRDEDIRNFPYLDPNAVRQFLALPVADKPGTHFVYNTPGTFIQSAIIQKVTGQSTLEYLRSRLFEPLGIASPRWDANPRGISLGGFGLSVTTEDIAKFGQLYLQKGKWQGKQLVPAAWVEQATARQMSNGSDPASDWDQGYGFQFWRCQHGFFRGDGAFGQYCIVLEKYDAVIAITSGTRDMPAILKLVWDELLPALERDTPLPPNAAADQGLKTTMATLSLSTPAGQETSPLADKIRGRPYLFPGNPQGIESLTVNPVIEKGSQTFSLRVGGAEQLLSAGYGHWVKGKLQTAGESEVVAASGAWTAEHLYTLKVVRYRTPFNMTYTLRFAGNEVLLDAEQNASLGERKFPQVIGKAR
jgi:CubicO group peptidase (beta-lactamase class C family)